MLLDIAELLLQTSFLHCELFLVPSCAFDLGLGQAVLACLESLFNQLLNFQLFLSLNLTFFPVQVSKPLGKQVRTGDLLLIGRAHVFKRVQVSDPDTFLAQPKIILWAQVPNLSHQTASFVDLPRLTLQEAGHFVRAKFSL